MSDLIANNNFHAMSKAFDTDALAELLEAASQREVKWSKKTSFAPSSFYSYGNGVCPRYWYYAFHGNEFEYDNSARSVANMNAGTSAGERIANLFEKAGILNDSEVEARHEDPPIFGFIDLDVKWQGEDIIGEVKTTTAEHFSSRAAKMKAPGYQLLQLLIYMYIKKRDKGFFLVENKNTHELLVIPIKMNDKHKKIVEDTFEWMRAVKKSSDDDLLPKRPFTKSSFNCKSCPVKKTCWEGYKRGSVNGHDPNPGVIEIAPLEVPK